MSLRACEDCGRVIEGASRRIRCDACATTRNAERESAADRGYGALWRKRRDAFLAKHPDCTDCGRKATVPDHAPKTRKQLVAEGVKDPDHERYLQPRCARCHNRRSAREVVRPRNVA